MKMDKFYKTNGTVGSTVLFWGLHGCGYVSDLDKAEIYPREDAQKDVDNGWLRGDEEIPLSAKHVNDLSEWRVDQQHTKISDAYPSVTDKDDEYVAYRKHTWDGNDLGFCSEIGYSFDYSKARVFSEHEVKLLKHENDFIFIAKSITDEVARRTFQWKNINRRKMISCAGVIGLRKKRNRVTSGKERWNCPSCGKISWQYHPYEFEGCNDVNCHEWTSQYDRCHP